MLQDAFNSYGVGWFEPFSHYRVSFNTMFVADPFFSIWPAVAFVALLSLKGSNPTRKRWWLMAISTSSLYLGYCLLNKVRIDADVERIFARKNIFYNQSLTTPTPLNNWLWYVAVGDSSGFYTGYRSVFDIGDDLELTYFPRNSNLLREVSDHESLQRLLRFSKGFYTVEKWNDSLVFNDLRFQQINGWGNPKEKFVFHYFLQHGADNTLVMQRGRFAKWDRKTLRTLIERIEGH